MKPETLEIFGDFAFFILQGRKVPVARLNSIFGLCAFIFSCFSFFFSCVSFFLSLSNLFRCQQALEAEFNCFLRGRCSMEMWFPGDMGRDSWDWVGPPAWGRACFNSPEWGGGSSRRKRIVAKENGASLDWIIVAGWWWNRRLSKPSVSIQGRTWWDATHLRSLITGLVRHPRPRHDGGTPKKVMEMWTSTTTRASQTPHGRLPKKAPNKVFHTSDPKTPPGHTGTQ